MEIASGSGLERLRVHDSPRLVDGHQAVGSDCLEALTDAAGPTHLDIGGLLGAEAEVQAPVIHRQEAGLPGHLLDLLAASIADQRAGADGAAVGFGGVQLELEPAVVPFDVIAKKRRWFDEVDGDLTELILTDGCFVRRCCIPVSPKRGPAAAVTVACLWQTARPSERCSGTCPCRRA